MDIVKKIAFTIKIKKPQVVDLIQKYGGVIKKNDSDVKVGDELNKILARNTQAQKDLALIISGGDSADPSPVKGSGLTSVLSGITGVWGSITGAVAGGGSTPTDALRLALINQGIERDKTKSTGIIIAIIVLVMVMLLIGFLIYKKYNK